ncbi:MAG: methyltransferase [Bacteroidetes bacterium]|nr:MAG: methyltransferase [Bacteroidota bacterium]TAG90637.1 MAG: methyltransferase [Bacteroidota bacterium]
MANERLTEEIVRNHFKNDVLHNVIKIEEQKSSNKKIQERLKNASKSGEGIGKPEFIISFPVQNSDFLILVECKASVSKHESQDFDKAKDYAVDGVLHYAKFLSQEFDVVAIGVSGENEQELKVSTFRWKKGEPSFSNENTNKLISINDYLKIFQNDNFSENLKNIDIIQKAVFLNDEFQSYSITENTRCTIVSAILLSLLDNTFKTSYATYEQSHELAEGILDALKRVLNKNTVRNQDSMLGEFQKITNEPIFKQAKIKRKKEEILTIEIAKNFIDYLHKNIFPLIKMDEAGIDILGKFYTEFIRYAGSSKTQGLVLTPFHITDLFCDLANITTESVVYDPCCGSGGFLIAAMKRMLALAGNDSEQKNKIKSSQLVGVERRPDMFTYACSNMLFRGDGKSNIYCGDCFNLETQIVQNHNINVVFLNPPYDVRPAGQMEFIEHGLKVIGKNNGIVVAIVQMSCAIKNEKDLIAIKKRLLEKHHLKAVISMPNEIFSPAASVVTCVMVWEANKQNKGLETWFGYLKDDGFEKRKHKGRIDVKEKWEGIREKFVNAYKNSKEIEGLSVKKSVNANDEWCAEAYMETDYSTLTIEDFEKVVKSLYAFKIINE